MSWGITITDNNGDTYTPDIYAPRGQAFPQEIPAANGTPTLRFGVLPLGTDSWFDSKFENCDISVTKDGTTQPYSRLIGAVSESANGVIVLEADGGKELQNRVDESFGIIETHNAAEQVVTNNTSYGVDIPTPSTTASTAELVRDRSGGVLSDDLPPQPETSPAYVTGGNDLTFYQTLHFETPPSGSDGTLDSYDDVIQFDFTTGYAIPPEQVGMGFNSSGMTNAIGIEMSIDGTVINRIEPGEDLGSSASWVRREGSANRLPPGSHTARFEVTDETDAAGNTLDSASPGGLAVYDARFEYTWDPALEDGPELYPSTATPPTNIGLTTAIVTRAVTGATFSGTWQDGNQGNVRIGNGVNTANGTGSVDADFTDRGDRITSTVNFVAYGTDTGKIPNFGFKCQTLQSFTLDGDLETMPMISNERFQGTVAEVLTELADTLRGDFVWTYDTDTNGNPIVRFVRTGARTETQNAIESFRIDKQTETQLQEVKVIGGVVDVTGEGLRVDHDTAVPLNRDNLIEGSETVEQDGTVFERGVHYSIDYDAGTITVDGNPATDDPIPDQTRVRVSYKFEPSGTVTASGVSTPTRTRVVDSLPLRSDAACTLAAEQILDAASAPQYNARAGIRGDTTFSAVTELVANRLPVSNLEVTDITATPGGASVRLEGRQAPGAIVAEVRDRITNVARNVR